MSRWFRHYAGMMRDDKLVRVSIRSKQTIERVAWIWGAILESAAEIDDGGRYDFDAEEAAYFLRADVDDILAVARELENAGRLAGGFVVKWGDRQFQSDRSAERQRRYRERQKNGDSDSLQKERTDNADVTVTSPSRQRDAPETETETYTSVSKDTGLTPEKIFWDRAKPYIGGRNPGGVIGKWCRDHGKDETKRAITEAQAANAVDPVPYVERILRRSKTAESLPVC